MNRDDIIRMAREACGEPAWDGGVEWTWEEVERFAALVAAAEREAFDAKYPIQLTHDQYNVVINAALKDEREACALVCDELVNHAIGKGDNDAMLAAFSCSLAIRERGAP